jgi:phage-related minor tail protein
VAQKINGITIALNADTRGVTNGLKDLTDQSVTLSKQLKSVESLLQMDPGNAELMAKKQELLAQSVDVSRQRLEALRGAQEDVQAAVASGSIGTDEYIAFQRELITTEKRMEDLENQSGSTGDEMEDLAEDTDEAGDQMRETADESGKLGEKLKSGLAAGAKLAAEGLAAVTAAASATVAGVVKTASATAETGDHIDKMSQKLGMSAEKYQEWDAIMQHSGSDVDKMGVSMKKLAEAVEKPTDKTADAFKKLGISMEDASKMSQEELFAKTIKSLQGMESGTERAVLANDLLGKSAQDLGALLNTSAADTEAMRKKVHELGGVMSNDAVKASARYQDSLQDMKTAIGGVVNSIGASFMPSISDMMDGFAALVTGNEEGIEQMEKGLDDFVKNLENTVSNIAAAADKFLPTIINAIAKNLPKIAESALKILKTLADALLDNLPQIVSTAAQIILSLAKGLADALPTLVPQVVGIIKEIVNILTDKNNLDALIDAAIAILTELSKALVDNLPELVDAALTLITRLVEYLLDPENIDKLVTASFEIIVNLAKALVDSIWKIGEACGQIVKKIVDALGLGEYWEAGMKVIDEFMGGVKEKWESWKKWWEGFGEAVYDYLHGTGGDEPLIDESAVWKDPRYSAKGGVFTVPTRAIIGENGAEVVLPLENNTGWMDILAAKLAAIGGSGMNIGTITVNVSGGTENAGIETVQAIDEALRQYQLMMTRGTGGVSW